MGSLRKHSLITRHGFRRGYQQLDALRVEFGFSDFTPSKRREILAWLLPVALSTTNPISIGRTLMDELRRRHLIVPGPFIVEQLVAAVMVLAERHVGLQLIRSLLPWQCDALDALLVIREGTAMSVLAWARQPPGAPGHRALARLVEQRAALRAIGLDPACAEGVHLNGCESSPVKAEGLRPSICDPYRRFAVTRRWWLRSSTPQPG